MQAGDVDVPTSGTAVRYDAIVLAGGRGSRLGEVDKAQVLLLGAPLIDRPLEACAGARDVVVVGPASAVGDHPVRVVREEPVGGGPAAATAAGLAALSGGDHAPAPWVVLLSCDLPMAEEGVARLLGAAFSTAPPDDVDGWLLVSDEGRPQWLFGIYRTERLQAALGRHPEPTGMSMRALLAGLNLALVPGSGDVSDDLDTWDDHAAWTARLEA